MAQNTKRFIPEQFQIQPATDGPQYEIDTEVAATIANGLIDRNGHVATHLSGEDQLVRVEPFVGATADRPQKPEELASPEGLHLGIDAEHNPNAINGLFAREMERALLANERINTKRYGLRMAVFVGKVMVDGALEAMLLPSFINTEKSPLPVLSPVMRAHELDLKAAEAYGNNMGLKPVIIQK
ncbi:MAG: hypothetical protein AAB436_00450 [Patescibacteria group bacterium]